MQHNNHKKESFKLLQLSDDSKSLTELELPQVQPQRKRKILRKTRNTSPHSARLAAASGTAFGGHHAHDASTSPDSLLPSACSSNFGLWIAVVMTCGWLFILSYMTAVVYSENRRLEAQLFKLSASAQTVPDELQRWHESAKWLEQNQTAAQTRLAEADQRTAALGRDLLALRTEFKAKYDDASDHEKIARLQTNMANLGAQLKDATIAMAALKEQQSALRADSANASAELSELAVFVHSTKGAGAGSAAVATSVGPGQPPLSNETVLWLVHNVTDETRTQVHRVAVDLDALKYAADQRAKGLAEDVREHRQRLDQLTENYANLTAHVGSMGNSLREQRAQQRLLVGAGGGVSAGQTAPVAGSPTISPAGDQQPAAAAATTAPSAAESALLKVLAEGVPGSKPAIVAPAKTGAPAAAATAAATGQR